MDREILLRQLVQAEQDVAEGKAFIAKQQRLIVESEREGCHDTAETQHNKLRPANYDRAISANVRSRSVSRSITPSRATSTSLRVTLSLSA